MDVDSQLRELQANNQKARKLFAELQENSIRKSKIIMSQMEVTAAYEDVAEAAEPFARLADACKEYGDAVPINFSQGGPTAGDYRRLRDALDKLEAPYEKLKASVFPIQ